MPLPSSLEKKVTAGFALALLLLGATGVASLFNLSHLRAHTRAMDRSDRVVERLGALRTALADAELAQGAYLLSGEERQRVLFEGAAARVTQAAEELHAVTLDDSSQGRRARELARMIAERTRESRAIIAVRRSRGLEAARAELTARDVRSPLDRLFAALGDLRDSEMAARHASETDQLRRAAAAGQMVFAGSTAALWLVGASLLLVRRDYRKLYQRDERQAAASARLGDSLHASEEGFRLLVEGVRDHAIYMVDPAGTILTWNSGGERITGWTGADVVGRHVSMFYPPSEAQAGMAERALRTAESDGSHAEEGWRARKDGSQFWAAVTITAVRDPQGRLRGFAQVTRDLTERHRAEEALRESELRMAGVIASAMDGVITVDEQQRITLFNAAAERMFQRSAAEMLGQPLDRLVPSRFREQHAAHVEEFGRTQVTLRSMGRLGAIHGLRADGSEFPIEASISQVEVQGRKVFSVILRDITARLRSEESLRRQARLMEASFDAVVVWELDGPVVFWNHGAEAVYGYSAEEAVGQDCHELLRTSPATGEARPTEELRRHGVWTGLLLHRTRDGRTIEVESRQRVVTEAGWRPLVFETNRDVTDRRRAERLLSVQARVGRILSGAASLAGAARELIEAIGEVQGFEAGALWEVEAGEPRLRCLGAWHRPGGAAAPLAEALRGAEAVRGEGVAGRAWQEAAPVLVSEPGGGEGHVLGLPAVRAGLTSDLGFPIIADGEVLGVVELFGRSLGELDEPLRQMIATTGGQIARYMQHRRGREEMQRLLSLSPAVTYSLRIEADRLWVGWVSPNLVAITGYLPEESTAPGWWLDGLHPEDQARVVAAQPLLYQEERQALEFRFRRKDGRYIWIHDERRLLRRADGTPVEVVGSWSDVSSRMLLEAQLRQAQKMEAIGQLAGGVAHDFNNLLTVIQGHVSLLESDPEVPTGVRESTGEITRAIERASALTRQLLLFSRRQVPQRRDLDLNDVVAHMIKLLQRVLGEDVHVRLALTPDPLWVHADAAMVDQVLLNLAVNARDAMPRGGNLTISTTTVELDAAAASQVLQGRPGAYACMEVSDTGTGIAREHLARIFEPFFTTKEPGQGTGLGLATVFGIMEQHQGWVSVYSEQGLGTTFRVYLPRTAGRGGGEVAPAPRPTAGGANETILVVEDEASLRAVVHKLLIRLGYRVLTARTGPEALELWGRHRDEIRLLLTDLVMPGGMTGIELAAQMLKDSQRLRVIYTSGFSAELAGRELPLVEGTNFLPKPYHLAKLASTIRDALDSA